MAEKPEDHTRNQMLPLAPATFFVLFSLAEGPRHGYRIMKDVHALSNGNVRMGPATLYTTIQRLTEQELIEELPGDAGSRRRNYRLSAAGNKLLQAEFERQSEVLKLARRKKIFRQAAKA